MLAHDQALTHLASSSAWLAWGDDFDAGAWEGTLVGEDCCRATLAGSDCLACSSVDARGRVSFLIWKFSPHVDADFGRHQGSFWVGRVARRSDLAMVWSIVRAWNEPFPVDAGKPPPPSDAPASEPCPVTLTITAPAAEPLGDGRRALLGPGITARFENRGARTVTLVAPGEGSEHAWRTPVAWFTMSRDGQDPVDATRPPWCMHVAGLEATDLVTLPPGWAWTTSRLGSVGTLVDAPGVYSIQFHYINHPAQEWINGDAQDPELMDAVRQSTPCGLISNTVRIRVYR